MFLNTDVKKRRVAIIGLDGMSWSILLRYLDDMPNVRKLVYQSLVGILRCIPPLTPPSWTSIFTGVRMDKHGIYGFTKYIKHGNNVKPTFFGSSDVRVPRLSEILALVGYKSLVVGFPLSYPIQGWYLKNHVLVYDAFAPKPFIYPPSYENYLKYFKYIDYKQVRPSDLAEKIMDNMIKYVEMRIKGMELLLSEIGPDTLITIFPETDNAMHIKPNIAGKRYDQKYARLLTLIDEFIGNIVKSFEIVLIVSDHGIELYRKCINMAHIINILDPVYQNTLKERLISTMMSNYFMGLILYSMLKHEISYRVFYRIRRSITNVALSSMLRGVDDSVTNLEEKLNERKILLDLGDADDSWLLYLRDVRMVGSTLRVIKKVLEEKLQSIEIVKVSSDMYAMLTIPKEGFYLEFGALHAMNSKNVLWYPSTRHSPYGVFLLWQRSIEASKYVGIVENYDILPSILALLRVPIPSYSDGSVIKTIKSRFSTYKYLDYRPIWKIAKRMYWLHQSMNAS